MGGAAVRPRLVAKARLRRDPVGEGWLLLYPERGLALNHAAAAIVRLCDGTRTLDDIVARLAAEHSAPTEQLRADVADVVATLNARNLLTR